MGVAFGHISHRSDGDSPGYYLEDQELMAEARRLGKFRDQAFDNYRNRNDPQKQWLHRSWIKSLSALEEEREYARIKDIFDAHVADMDGALKNAERLGGKPFADHLTLEKESFMAFRKHKGL